MNEKPQYLFTRRFDHATTRTDAVGDLRLHTLSRAEPFRGVSCPACVLVL